MEMHYQNVLYKNKEAKKQEQQGWGKTLHRFKQDEAQTWDSEVNMRFHH